MKNEIIDHDPDNHIGHTLKREAVRSMLLTFFNAMDNQPRYAFQISEELTSLLKKHNFEVDENTITIPDSVTQYRSNYKSFVNDCHKLARKYSIGKYASATPVLL